MEITYGNVKVKDLIKILEQEDQEKKVNFRFLDQPLVLYSSFTFNSEMIYGFDTQDKLIFDVGE